MSFKGEAIDRFAVRLTHLVIRFRWIVPVIGVLIAALVGSGASNLEFSTNYRTFFSKENPELTAFENLQATYTKNDNILFVLVPEDGEAFSGNTMAAVEALTTAAWQIPYVIRVDSVTNFQHTRADGDDIIVEDLIVDAAGLSQQELSDRKSVALAEPLLRDQLVTGKADVTAVNVVLQYPQETLTEVPEAAAAAREIRGNIEAEFAGIDVSLSGVSMLNNSFAEVGERRRNADAANVSRHLRDDLAHCALLHGHDFDAGSDRPVHNVRDGNCGLRRSGTHADFHERDHRYPDAGSRGLDPYIDLATRPDA